MVSATLPGGRVQAERAAKTRRAGRVERCRERSPRATGWPQRVDWRLLRILDANLNRAREGLRVCEDVARLGYDDPALTERLKRARHGVTAAGRRLPVPWHLLLAARGSDRDVGCPTGQLGPHRRGTVRTLFIVNMQRAKEALRVLEEGCRLIAPSVSRSFARLRFRLYAIEATFAQRRHALRHR